MYDMFTQTIIIATFLIQCVLANDDAPSIINQIHDDINDLLVDVDIKKRHTSNDLYSNQVQFQEVNTNSKEHNRQDIRRAGFKNLDPLNALIEGWQADIKPFTIYDLPPPLATSTSMQIQKCTCFNFRVGTAELFVLRDDTEAINQIKAEDFEVECNIEWAFRNWVIVLERGTANMKASRGKADMKIVVESTDYNVALPSEVVFDTSEDCKISFQIDDLSLTGFVRAWLANTFDTFVGQQFTDLFGPELCAAFNQKKIPIVRDLIDEISALATPYLNEINKDQVDPLEPQQNLPIPTDARLFNFTSRDENDLGAVAFNSFVDNFDEEYKEFVLDVDGEPLLAINQVVRDVLLDEDRKFTFPFVDWILDGNGLLYDGYDLNIRIEVFLENIRFKGLDSINEFSVLNPIGRQTLQSHLNWTDVEIEMDIRADLSSTDPDLPLDVVLVIPETTLEFTASVKFEDFTSTVTFLSAIDVNIVQDLEMRQVLISECSLAFLPGLDISQLEIQFDEKGIVKVSNLIAPGVERIAERVGESFLSMYQLAISDAVPNFVATTLRETIQNQVNVALDAFGNRQCTPITGNSGANIVNFNDLLFNTTESIQSGILPEIMPYGDSMAKAKEWFTTTFLSPNLDGNPFLNDLLIKPLTLIFSKSVGKLSFTFPSIQCNDGEERNKISLRIESMTFENLDSFGFPLQILDPDGNDPFKLMNEFVVGIQKPLQLTANIVISNGNGGFSNSLNVTLSLVDTNIKGDIFAKILEESFLNYPLRDIFNPFCLLSTISPPETSEISSQTLSLLGILIDSDGGELSIECTSCSSSGMVELPQLLETLKASIDLTTKRFLQSFEEFLNGGDAQSIIDILLSIAGSVCPHHPDYNEDVNASLIFEEAACQGSIIPTLSRNSTELLILSTILSSYMALVIVPLSSELDSIPDKDPLETQATLDIDGLLSFVNSSSISPLSGEIISFLTLIDELVGGTTNSFTTTNSTSIDILLNDTISNVTSNITEVITDPPLDLKERKLGINYLFSGFDPLQIDVFRSLIIPSPSYTNSDEFTNMTLEVVRIYGLDSFYDFDLFDPIGAQTIRSHFGITNISLELIGLIDLPSTTPERVKARINLKDFNITTSILAAIDEIELSSINLGYLLDKNLIQSCVLPSLQAFSITEFRPGVSSIDSIEFTGFLSDQALLALSESSESFLDAYTSLITFIFPKFADNVIRQQLNEHIGNLISNEEVSLFANITNCLAYNGTDEFIDFRKMFTESVEVMNQTNATEVNYGDIPPIIRTFIDNYFEAPDTRSNFREAESSPRLNGYLPESFFLSNTIFDFRLNLNQTKNGADDIAEIKVSELTLKNIDSVTYPLDILKPRQDDPYVLDSIFTIGTEERPFIVEFVLEGSFTGATTNIVERLNVSLAFNHLQFSASSMAKINAASFFNLPILSMLDINCLLATIPPPRLFGEGLSKTASINFDLTYTNIKVSVDCIACTSPQLELLGSTLNSSSSEATINVLVQSAIQTVKGPLEEALQLQIDAALLSAGPKCANFEPNIPSFAFSTDFPTNARKFGIGILLPFFFFVVFFFILSRLMNQRMKSNHQMWLMSLPEDRLLKMFWEQVQKEKEEEEQIQNIMPIIMNEDISFALRFLLPVLVATTFGLLLSGHISVAAYTNIEGEFGGEEVLVSQLFTLKIIDGISDGWSNGTGFLSFILVLVTLLFPYIKLFIILVVWFLPPSQLSITKRDIVLVWLDELTKWSVLSMFVLFLAIPFYNLSVTEPKLGLFPENLLDLQVELVLVWGFYGTLLAQIMSHVVSNISVSVVAKKIVDFVEEDDVTPSYEVDVKSMDYYSDTNDYSSASSRSMSTRSVSRELFRYPKSSKSNSVISVGSLFDSSRQTRSEALTASQTQPTENSPKRIMNDSSMVSVGSLFDSSRQNKSETLTASPKQLTEEVFSETNSSKQAMKILEHSNVSSHNKSPHGSISKKPHNDDTNTIEDSKERTISESIKYIKNKHLPVSSIEVIRTSKIVQKQRTVSVGSLFDSDAQPGSDRLPSRSEQSKFSKKRSDSSSNSSSEDYTSTSSSSEQSKSTKSREYMDAYGLSRALCNYRFKLNSFAPGATMAVPQSTNMLIGMLSILIIILLFVGSGTAIFNIKVFGLLSTLVPTDASSVDYSVFQVVRLFRESAGNLDSGQLSFGLFLLSSVFIVTVVLAPLFRITMLTSMWFLPMRMRLRYILLKGIRISQSWQYLEVLIVSVLLLMWQGEGFTETYLDGYCDNLKETFFPLAVFTGLLDEKNARCIYIALEPRVGLFILIIVYFMLVFVTQFVKKATEHHIEDFQESMEAAEAEEHFNINLNRQKDEYSQESLDEILSKFQREKPRFTDSFGIFLSPTDKAAFNRVKEDDVSQGSSKSSISDMGFIDVPTGVVLDDVSMNTGSRKSSKARGSLKGTSTASTRYSSSLKSGSEKFDNKKPFSTKARKYNDTSKAASLKESTGSSLHSSTWSSSDSSSEFERRKKKKTFYLPFFSKK